MAFQRIRRDSALFSDPLPQLTLPDSSAKGDKARLCLGKMDLKEKCLIKSQLGSGNQGGRGWEG